MAAQADRAERVCLGAIAGVHGVRGAVRIKSFTAEPRDVAAYGALTDEAGEREFMLTVTGESRGQIIARIAGVNDRDAAAALKGTRLYVARSRLPTPEPDEFYHTDLIGLEAIGPDGKRLGTVSAVHDFGAGGLLEIGLDGGGSVMLPFTAEAVPEVDFKAGRVVVVPPTGLLDDDLTDNGPEDERR